MSDGWMILIELITGWFLTAFSAFVPKMKGCRMGTGQNGDNGRAFPADFFPNLRKFFCFFPFYLFTFAFSTRLRNRSLPEVILSLNRAYLSLIKAILSLNNAYLSLNQANLSLPKPQSLSIHRKFALYLAVNRS